MKGIELSRRYFEEVGKKVFSEKFPSLYGLLSFGLVGSGSDCYGFDDEVSRDHDFEPGFCVFYPDELLDRREVFELERAYASLPEEFEGYKRCRVNPAGGARHGVMGIGEFYASKIGIGDGGLSRDDWTSIPESYLFEATNGEVFEDNFGRFTNIRTSLLKMPEDVRLKKLSGNLLSASQSGQYNLPRCLSHGERGGAVLAGDNYVRYTASALFGIYGRYEPYYKWCFKALRQLSPISDLLEEILCTSDFSEKERLISVTSDKVGELLVSEGFVDGRMKYLEDYAYKINEKITDNSLRNESLFYAVR